MTPPQWAPLAAAGAAVALRFAGARLRRPAVTFAAAGLAQLLGWALLPTPIGTRLPVFAAAALAAAAFQVTPAPPPKRRAKSAAPAAPTTERWLWLTLLALAGAWWLTGAGTLHPLPFAAAAIAILAAGLLATDLWSVAAASLSLAAAVAAVGAGLPLAALALVVTAACAGAGASLPLIAGLGAAIAVVLNAGLQHTAHHAGALCFTPLAPLACLLLLAWWRTRFTRFGAAAAPVRAGVAAGLVCLLAFSAAAMEGLR